ncbi:MAG: TetR/AcrR family transcriptional regulator [Clostridia bacterium]|nr:TetR/AcrR family transcriptional regulator [Clostridia bacterium]
MERNSKLTKQNILNAAIKEFSDKGLAGARIDTIAADAGCNKGMIYQYYGSKEALYECVIKYEYESLLQVEVDIVNDKNMNYMDMISIIIDKYFDFLFAHPDFVKIIMWENLNEARTMKNIATVSGYKAPIIEAVESMVRKGRDDGVFGENVRTRHVVFALITGAFSYFSNRYTLPHLLGMDLDDEKIVKTQKKILHDSISGYLTKG